MAASPQEGVAMAQEVQRKGVATGTLARWVAASQKAAREERAATAAPAVAAAV